MTMARQLRHTEVFSLILVGLTIIFSMVILSKMF